MTSGAGSDDSPAGEFQPVGGKLERGLIWVFIVVPTLALLPGILFAWGGGSGWLPYAPWAGCRSRLNICSLIFGSNCLSWIFHRLHW